MSTVRATTDPHDGTMARCARIAHSLTEFKRSSHTSRQAETRSAGGGSDGASGGGSDGGGGSNGVSDGADGSDGVDGGWDSVPLTQTAQAGAIENALRAAHLFDLKDVTDQVEVKWLAL